MSTVAMKSGGLNSLQLTCRLCMGKDNLEDVYKDNDLRDLRQWISNYLSIRISSDDRKGHAICDVCRLRLSDFHQFWTRCQEVQAIRQSMIRDAAETSTWLGGNLELRHVKTEPCQQGDTDRGTEQLVAELRPSTAAKSPVNHFSHDHCESQVLPASFDSYGAVFSDNEEASTEMDIEQVKIEARTSDEESLDESGINFSIRNDLMNHELTEEHTRRIQVNQEPVVEDGYLAHQIKHKYSCSKCHQAFGRQCLLKKHMKSHDEKINEEQAADTDDEEFSSRKGDSDLSTNVSKADDQKWRCNQCDRSLPDEKKLKWHMRCHRSKTHICPICGKPFAYPFLLKNHIASHDPNHVRQPWGEATNAVGGPFRCDICQKEYGLRNRLRAHKAQVHAPKRHECHLCDSKYTTRKSLRKHILTHYRASGKA